MCVMGLPTGPAKGRAQWNQRGEKDPLNPRCELTPPATNTVRVGRIVTLVTKLPGSLAPITFTGLGKYYSDAKVKNNIFQILFLSTLGF